MKTPRTALVTGATGYVGGKLVGRLLEEGWQVRVLSRSGVQGRPWADDVDVVRGDATERADLDRALDGVEVAYYLLHSMDGEGDFAARDRALAHGFADAAAAAGVRRIVYLGGLHPEGKELSPHLASRVEVGDILLQSPVPTAVLQAAIVLGLGSASFDMLRYLAGRLPMMVAPRWLHNRIQPIAIDDVLHYLVRAADLPPEVNRTFDIGGPEVLTYEEMMQRFARLTGRHKRLIVAVPVLTPRLASHWVGLVTPVAVGVAKPLVDSLVHEVVCQERDLDELVGEPPGGHTSYDEAVRRAMSDAPRDTGRRNLLAVAGAVAATAAVGGLATTPKSRWYSRLDLPPWQPPGWAFGAVWTPLYADIVATTSAALTACERDGRDEEAAGLRRALAVNLVLNAGWSVVFWRLRKPRLATVEAAALALSSADLTRRVAEVDRARGLALAPYAGWTAFATALTAEIARRNPQRPRGWRRWRRG